MPKRMPDIATGKARLAQRLKEKAKAASAPAIDELTIACVGAHYANPKRKGQPTGSREMEIMFVERGHGLVLRPEPQNNVDANAIAVYAMTGIQIGYVSADRTILLHRAWETARDINAIFQERTPWGAWIRIAFDREPTLSSQTERPPVVEASADWWPDEAPTGDAFYPDPIYDD